MTKPYKNTKPLLFLMAAILFIAGLADLKYKGLFFRLLPESIKASLEK
ncbi:hypothetical protein ACW2QC_13950 [Virgibacillus sp. FSP13]